MYVQLTQVGTQILGRAAAGGLACGQRLGILCSRTNAQFNVDWVHATVDGCVCVGMCVYECVCMRKSMWTTAWCSLQDVRTNGIHKVSKVCDWKLGCVADILWAAA